MFKKYLALAIIVLMLNLAGDRLIFAQTQDDKSAKLAQKIKKQVTEIGVGEKSKVRVELQNRTKIKGYISSIDNDSFTITEKKTGMLTKIEYAQTQKVKLGYGLPTAVTIGVVAGLATAAVIALAILGKRYCNEASC